MNNTWNRPVPDWQLECFRLGELPVEEMLAVGRAVKEDETIRARLEALERDSAGILAEFPPRVMGACIRARLEASASGPAPRCYGWYEGLAATFTVALAVAGLLCLRPATEIPQPRNPVLEETRVKGLRPRLLVFRQTKAGAEALEPGSLAGKDDVIQLAYQAAGHRYGAIVSIDGRGVTTRHLPQSGQLASELAPGAPMALLTAYRLDDAPRFEVFYLVAADEPFEIGVVETAARKVGGMGHPVERLPLGDSFAQHSVVIRKDGVR